MTWLKEFKYLGVLLTSKGKTEREMDRRIGAASALIQALYQTFVVKSELRQKAKLSNYQSVYVPTFTYGHELRARSRATAPLRRKEPVEVVRASD